MRALSVFQRTHLPAAITANARQEIARLLKPSEEIGITLLHKACETGAVRFAEQRSERIEMLALATRGFRSYRCEARLDERCGFIVGCRTACDLSYPIDGIRYAVAKPSLAPRSVEGAGDAPAYLRAEFPARRNGVVRTTQEIDLDDRLSVRKYQ